MFAARLLLSRIILPLGVLAFGTERPLSAGQSFLHEAAEANVNQRYTIESVTVAGIPIDRVKLPQNLRGRLTQMVGARCDMAAIGDVASALRRELHLRAVNEHLSRGSQPDQIRVNFEVVKRDVAFDISVPKFLYHSKQGWSGEVDASARTGQQTFTVGAVSNGDDLIERFNGVVAHYQNAKVGSEKLRFGLTFEDFREQWMDSTRTAAAAAGASADLYSSRRNVAPELTFAPVKGFTVSAGMSFEEMESETPGIGPRSANAATAELNYVRSFEGDRLRQKIETGYKLRLGLHGLGSDYAYSRHLFSVRYQVRSGRQVASDELSAGAINGTAPLFETFVLGSSSTLRGWDRYSISPLGANRVIHNSLSYGYQFGEGTAEVFYDTGKTTSNTRHSLGVGYRQGIFVLTMAFPVVEGRIAPVFMAGMNY